MSNITIQCVKNKRKPKYILISWFLVITSFTATGCRVEKYLGVEDYELYIDHTNKGQNDSSGIIGNPNEFMLDNHDIVVVVPEPVFIFSNKNFSDYREYTTLAKYSNPIPTSTPTTYGSTGINTNLLGYTSDSFLCAPLEYLYVTSPFGDDRGYHTHEGIDLAPKSYRVDGDKVYASAEGKVTRVTRETVSYGNRVEIEHTLPNVIGPTFAGPITFTTNYSHLQPNSINVAVGDIVKKGQHIGNMGNTGISTGTHLHWHIILKPGYYVDPVTGDVYYSKVGNKIRKDKDAELSRIYGSLNIAPWLREGYSTGEIKGKQPSVHYDKLR